MLKNISAPAFGLPVFFTGDKKSERLTKEDEEIGENDKAKNVCKGKYLYKSAYLLELQHFHTGL